MGKIGDFKIHFDKKTPVYRSGESISGSVVVHVKERTKINSITASMKGGAKCEWNEMVEENGQDIHHNHESYVDQHFLLASEANHNEEERAGELFLSEGTHSWPFKTTLPARLPSSFQNETGSIRYSVRSTIHAPWSIDRHTDAAFTVLHELDLNERRADLGHPVQASETQCLGFGPFKHHNHPIEGTLSLAKSGFVPGEAIKFEAKLENSTEHVIRETTVSLRQLSTFKADKSHLTVPHVIAKLTYPHQIEGNVASTVWRGQLTVPPVCNTMCHSSALCSFIDIKYELMLDINMSRVHSTSHVHLPIVIGTIPFRTTATTETPTKEQKEDKAAESSSPSSPSTSSSFSPPVAVALPPPNYKECIIQSRLRNDDNKRGDHSDSSDSEGNQFIPLYPVYKSTSVETEANEQTTTL